MEFEIRAGPQGHYYLPKIVRKMLGERVLLVPNSRSAVVYPKGTELADVVQSLQIILADLQFRAAREGKEST